MIQYLFSLILALCLFCIQLHVQGLFLSHTHTHTTNKITTGNYRPSKSISGGKTQVQAFENKSLQKYQCKFCCSTGTTCAFNALAEAPEKPLPRLCKYRSCYDVSDVSHILSQTQSYNGLTGAITVSKPEPLQCQWKHNFNGSTQVLPQS